MTRKFIEKVLYHGVVDTKKYRYRVRHEHYCNGKRFVTDEVIERCKLDELNTTTALHYEEVYRKEVF